VALGLEASGQIDKVVQAGISLEEVPNTDDLGQIAIEIVTIAAHQTPVSVLPTHQQDGA